MRIAGICVRAVNSQPFARTLAPEFILTLHQRSVMRKALTAHAKPSVLLGMMVMVALLSTVVVAVGINSNCGMDSGVLRAHPPLKETTFTICTPRVHYVCP